MLLGRCVKRFLWVIAYLWVVIRSLWQYLFNQSSWEFLKALLRNPRTMGAVLPSSKRLANAMASYINAPDDSLIIELGAGTGVITEAILATGIPSERVIAIERAPDLAKILRERFPNITVIEGDAVYLTQLLKKHDQPIGAVVSGLPLRSLPNQTRENILAEIAKLLGDNGRYIQFTYDITNQGSVAPPGYSLSKAATVWQNIPPAKVNVYVKN